MNRNLFLQEYSIPSIQATDSKEFVLLSRVRMGHKREFAFAMKARSEICESLGWTLATLRYRESEGEKKTLRHTRDSYGRPSPSPFDFFRDSKLNTEIEIGATPTKDGGTYTMKKVLIQNTEQLELVREEIRVSSLFSHTNKYAC